MVDVFIIDRQECKVLVVAILSIVFLRTIVQIDLKPFLPPTVVTEVIVNKTESSSPQAVIHYNQTHGDPIAHSLGKSASTQLRLQLDRRIPLSSTIIASTVTSFPSPNGSTTSTSLPPRLEFLHIQKNAGSLLEIMAMKANISWGVCHFNFPWKRRSLFKDCPAIDNSTSRSMSSDALWHYPLQHLEDKVSDLTVYPYDNVLDESYVRRPKKFFVVIRNPYDRLISFYYHKHKRMRKRSTDSQYLNEFSQKIIRDGSHLGFPWENSSICQSPYLYDQKTGKKIAHVEHVVQFEFLAQDFNSLAHQYGLNFSIPDKKENANSFPEWKRMTVLNLTLETLEMLNQKCPQDFTLGRGYEMKWD